MAEFDIKKVEIFDRINFIKNGDSYVGKPANRRNKSDITLTTDLSYIECICEDKLLFKIGDDVSVGTLIVILQEFGIIHERYIYERVDAIKEEFLEYEW
jgi:hypothetical protein